MRPTLNALRATPWPWVACVVLASAGASALAIGCIPDPHGDFDDYTERTQAFQPATPEAGADSGGFDSGPPPTEASEGLYYGACLSQLAFGDPNRVFNFLTKTKFTPADVGGTLTLSLEALKFDPGPPPAPPATAGQAGVSGGLFGSVAPGTPNVEASGRYRVEIGAVTLNGDANPITQREVAIQDVFLQGQFSSGDRFCAQLVGTVTKPLQITLDPTRNTCLFVKVTDGQETPKFTAEDFTAGCPY